MYNEDQKKKKSTPTDRDTDIIEKAKAERNWKKFTGDGVALFLVFKLNWKHTLELNETLLQRYVLCSVLFMFPYQ